MSNPSLSMWHKTPQEWAEETRDMQVYTRGMATFPLLKTEAYLRTIVVHFYLDPQRYKLGLDPDMEALFELDEDQCLNLTEIAKRWGLETCVAIDPRRWIMFEGAREDKLSGFAVQTLFDKDGAITVVERPASPRALAIRARRRAVLAVYNPIASAVTAILTFLDAFTNMLYTPIEYALAPVGRAYDSWHKSYEEWYAEGFAPDSWEEEGLHGIIRLCKRILWLCLFAFLGYVAWQLHRDAYCNRTYMCDAKIWTTLFELPDEVCLLLTDELASPADFYLYSTAFQRLKSGRRVLLVSAADDLARWKAVAGKSGVNLTQQISSKAFEYYDVSAELDRILERVDQDGVPPLRALYDTIVDRLAQQEAPSLIILDALSELLWLGLPEKDARLFVRALRALCLKNHTGLIIRFHKTADGEHDEVLAFLTQLCQFRLDVCPLASGRSGLVSGEIVLRRGASCFMQHMHVKTIPRSSALQYRLSDYSVMYFEKGTDRAVL